MSLAFLKAGQTKNALWLLLTGVVLTGCADRVSLAEAEMQKIQQQPAQPITPPPQPQKIEDFVYGSNNAKPPRDPFIPQSLLELQARVASMPSVRPDENRPKEPLEEFELSSLIYRVRWLLLTDNSMVWYKPQTGLCVMYKWVNIWVKTMDVLWKLHPRKLT